MATPNSAAMNVAWLDISPLCTPCTCPFLILCIASYPCTVFHAVSKEKKPMAGLTRRLRKRWSCSIRLFKYLTRASVRLMQEGPFPPILTEQLSFCNTTAFLTSWDTSKHLRAPFQPNRNRTGSTFHLYPRGNELVSTVRLR